MRPRQRAYKVLRTTAEDVVQFDYRSASARRTTGWWPCARTSPSSGARPCSSRSTATSSTSRTTGASALTRVVGEARRRCNQENLIAQLKGGVRSLHAPVNNLNANWAYMTMASLAWSIKAWCALVLPVSARWADGHEHQRRQLLTMEFRTFRSAFIDIPCQIVKTARSVRWRVQAWNPWLGAFFRLLDAL